MVKADLNFGARIQSYGFLKVLKPKINARGLLDDVSFHARMESALGTTNDYSGDS